MKKNNHTFAILAYKESEFLSDCIESLLKQTVKSDLIITTSTPNDFIFKIAKIYNIKVYTNEVSDSIASDWSFAYKCADTDYITLTHQDDIYNQNYVEYFMQNAYKFKNNLILFSNYSELYNGEIREKNINIYVKNSILGMFFLFKKSIKKNILKKTMLAFGSPICCPSVMFNKRKIGDFEFNKNYTVNLDWEAWVRFAEIEGDFVYIKNKMVFHRIHKGSETSKGIESNRRRNEDKKIFLQIYPTFFAKIILKIYGLSYTANK